MAVVTTDVGQVTVITLEWPERRNAVGPEEVAEVADAIGAASGKGSRGLVVHRSRRLLRWRGPARHHGAGQARTRRRS